MATALPAGKARPSPTLLLLTALAAEAAIPARPCRHPAATEKVRVIQCGIGRDAVLQAARPHAGAARMIGSIGVSGGLAPDLAPGTVILGERIRNLAPGLEPLYVCAPDLVDLLADALEKAAISCHRGTLLCVRDPLLTPADKLAAHRRTGTLAVDLESAAAAATALAAGCPFFCLRVVCDPAGRSLAPELLRGVDSRGNSRPLRLLAPLLRRPALLIPLLVMARDFSRARRRLAQAWQAICPTLATRSLSGRDRAGPP